MKFTKTLTAAAIIAAEAFVAMHPDHPGSIEISATADEASQLLALVAQYDPLDAWSRHNPQWNSRQAFGAPAPGFRFGVPQTLNFLGCAQSESLFMQAKARLMDLGGVPVNLDMTPFLAAARLLYDGPWVAERYAVVGPLIAQQPDAVLPVIRDVLAKAPDTDAVATFRAMYQLQEYKAQCDALLETLDCVLTPTCPRPVTLAELAAQAALSEYHFARMFRQSTGLAPHQYVMKRRMEKAKALVQNTATPLTDIALACGFNSASHFSNRFRSATGMTPSQLRAASA